MKPLNNEPTNNDRYKPIRHEKAYQKLPKTIVPSVRILAFSFG